MKYARRSRKTTRRPARTAKKSLSKASTVSFKKKVMRVLASKIEKKIFLFNSANSIYPSNSASFASSFLPVTPYTSIVDIQQGNTQSSRIGNKISVKRAWLDLHIYPNTYSATTNINPRPMILQVIFAHSKDAPTTLDGVVTDLFQNNGSATGYANSLNDLFRPINSDSWVVKKRMQFKLGCATYGGTGTQAAAQSFTNNDFKYCIRKRIDLTKMVPKTITYSDTSTVPTSNIIQMMVQVVPADNTTFGAAEIPCAYVYQLCYEYTDL